MKARAKLQYQDLPRDYHGLVLLFMPKAVYDPIDYENTIEIINTLAGHELTSDQELYLDTLSTLVEAYEEDRYANTTRKLGALDALKFLLEENDMTPSDLGRLLGERTIGSKILRGERKIGLTYAKALAKRFAVDIGVFVD